MEVNDGIWGRESGDGGREWGWEGEGRVEGVMEGHRKNTVCVGAVFADERCSKCWS